MSKQDLNRPMQGAAPKRRGGRIGAIVAPLLISLALIVALIAGVWVAVVDDPDGGHPVAVATIETPQPPSTGSIPAHPAAPAASLPPADAHSDELALAAMPHLPPTLSADPSLIEQSSFGPLPRVSPDGRRPRDAYARRAAPVPDGVPRVVLVIGGLGLSQTGTQRAIEVLPPDVTLAFAPYGASLDRWVGKARDQGHEVLLQIPLEPGDYPNVDPGPHTLLVSGSTNRDDLHWSLGRMSGYAGVMNHMGARFLEDEDVVLPFLGEIGDRGLFFLDDGSTGQDVAGKIGEAIKVPVVTADRTLDRVRTPAAIGAALSELEAIARSRGIAIGVASAFPVSVDAVAAWARDAQKRGIVIIPASAAANS
jgi:polysaccharide deacetylase 2 family uncharacterized protein YibQ